ncbi:MAG: hypothetical protein ABL951_16535, partial [Alphaproteobacteria bacterium]
MEPHVRNQLEGLTLDPRRPLIVTDADEVVAYFIAGLERFLERNGYWLDLRSFAITGNIRKRGSDEISTQAQVKELLAGFFDTEVEALDPVDGAAEALQTLSKRAQIIVLSNVPPSAHMARQRWLRRHAMDYPLIANAGSKGLALRFLSERISAPVFFLDDLPPHLDAVAEQAGSVCLLHFIADKRLAALVAPAQ